MRGDLNPVAEVGDLVPDDHRLHRLWTTQGGEALLFISDQAQALGCSSFRLPLTRGQLALGSGDLDAAGRFLEEALGACSSAEEEVLCLEQRGSLELQRGEPMAAVATYRALLQRAPGDSLGHYNLGNSLELAGQRELARQSFVEALRLDPSLEPAARRIELIDAQGP